MTVIGWIQILLYCGIVAALVVPLGAYMTRVFNGERTLLSPLLRPVEAALYWLGGVDERREQHWVTYTVSMLFFHVGGFLILYALMRLQAGLPFNPAEQSAVAPDLSFNTAVSFITNTNWQNYGGESTLSYLVQMLGLTHQNFLSAATGIVLAVALIRGFARASMRHDRQFLGRYHALHALHPHPDLHHLRAVPGLAGHATDARPLRRGDHA
jgi:potassium-transporting ATPase potassium-binding subunit